MSTCIRTMHHSWLYAKFMDEAEIHQQPLAAMNGWMQPVEELCLGIPGVPGSGVLLPMSCLRGLPGACHWSLDGQDTALIGPSLVSSPKGRN